MTFAFWLINVFVLFTLFPGKVEKFSNSVSILKYSILFKYSNCSRNRDESIFNSDPKFIDQEIPLFVPSNLEKSQKMLSNKQIILGEGKKSSQRSHYSRTGPKTKLWILNNFRLEDFFHITCLDIVGRR